MTWGAPLGGGPAPTPLGTGVPYSGNGAGEPTLAGPKVYCGNGEGCAMGVRVATGFGVIFGTGAAETREPPNAVAASKAASMVAPKLASRRVCAVISAVPCG